MKILITGGLGFIGSQLARDLAQLDAHELYIVDNLSPQIHGQIPLIDECLVPFSNITFLRADVRNPGEFESILCSADAIVHLAAETGTAQSMYQIGHYNAVNVQATANLLDYLANHKTRVSHFVLASSRSIYGEGAYKCPEHGIVYPVPRTADQLAARRWNPTCPSCARDLEPIATPEAGAPSPASIYAATKHAQEELVRIACTSMGINASILRFQNVYGAGQSLNNPYTGILSIFSTRIRRGLSLPIFEDGGESRDFVHVSDVAQAMRLCIEKDLNGVRVYNVGSGEATAVIDIATMLVDALQGRVAPHVTGQYRIGDIRHCFADISHISAELGYRPAVKLYHGLRDFCAWVCSQPLPADGLDEANEELKKRNLMK